jgi:hypothetical protein
MIVGKTGVNNSKGIKISKLWIDFKKENGGRRENKIRKPCMQRH